MWKKVKSILFTIAIAIGTVAIYQYVEGEFLRWVSIFCFMIVAMGLASLILKEHPYEFFDNFGNYKDAKVSAIFMVVAAIALVMAFKAFIVILVNG